MALIDGTSGCSQNSGALSPDPDIHLQPNFLETREGNKKRNKFQKIQNAFGNFQFVSGLGGFEGQVKMLNILPFCNQQCQDRGIRNRNDKVKSLESSPKVLFRLLNAKTYVLHDYMMQVHKPERKLHVFM